MRRRSFLSALALPLAPAAVSAAGLSDRRAPGFALPDLDFKIHDLNDYLGKVVVVDVMRTGCPHCAVFSKRLEAAEKKFAGKAKILQVVNPPDNQNSVKGYLEKNALSTTVLFDCGQMAASYLKITPQKPSFEVPHFFVIDPKGWIREDHGYNMLSRGLFEGDGVEAIIDRYIPKTA